MLALRMKEAGVPASYKRFNGMIHGGLPQGIKGDPFKYAVDALKQAFYR
jgi:acetyl esterase/lipase